MNRFMIVALCAVALFAMAPFAYAEDAPKEFAPPENPVTNLYHALTPDGEVNTNLTKEELTALAEQYGADWEERPAIRVAEDGLHEYWTFIWDAEPTQDPCSVLLHVSLVEGKLTGATYIAQRGDGERPQVKPAGDLPTEPENPCLALHNEVAPGMNEEEFLALAKKHGLVSAKIHNDMNRDGQKAWGYNWSGHKQGEWWWQVMLFVEFTDGKVSKVTHIPLCWRQEEKK